MMVQDREGDFGSAWISDKLDWDRVQNAKVRAAVSLAQVPAIINGIELMPMTRQFLAWWLFARGEAQMPSPAQIDHKALVELLPFFRMLRWEGEESLVIRLLGTAIVEVIGADYTGIDVLADKTLPGFAQEVERYQLLHSHPCGLLLRRGLTRRDGSVGVIEIVSLPVSADGEGKTRVVGTVAVCERWDDPQQAIRMVETFSPVPKLERAAFIDLGFGLPDAAARLNV